MGKSHFLKYQLAKSELASVTTTTCNRTPRGTGPRVGTQKKSDANKEVQINPFKNSKNIYIVEKYVCKTNTTIKYVLRKLKALNSDPVK